jgi:hypothetical protein
MRYIKNFFYTGILLLLTFNLLVAQIVERSSSDDMYQGKDAFRHAINVCPIAPIFGIYALNYEQLITPRNGILARVEYEDVPKTYTDANIESNGWAYSVNYRRHLSDGLNSLFVGAFVRYRTYSGEGFIENSNFDFTLTSFTYGLNAGKRWVWNRGFNLTISMGYGISNDDRDPSRSSPLIEASLDQLEDEYDFMTPFYGEVSVGYAF